MQHAIPEDTDETTRRFLMLNRGDALDWFGFRAANPPGYVDHQGVTYTVWTYSIMLHDETQITLVEGEVEGFVYATALEHDQVAEIAYRDGM